MGLLQNLSSYKRRNTSITYRCIRKYILHFKRLAISFGFSHGSSVGMKSISTWEYIMISIILLVTFIIHESKVKHPIIDVHLCQHSNFYRSYICNSRFWSGLSNYFIIPPYFLQAFTQLTPWQTGFVFIISPWFSNIFANSRKIHGTFWAKITYENRFMCYVYSICWIKLYPSPLVTIYNGELITSIWGGGEFSSLLILHQL